MSMHSCMYVHFVLFFHPRRFIQTAVRSRFNCCFSEWSMHNYNHWLETKLFLWEINQDVHSHTHRSALVPKRSLQIYGDLAIWLGGITCVFVCVCLSVCMRTQVFVCLCACRAIYLSKAKSIDYAFPILRTIGIGQLRDQPEQRQQIFHTRKW